jgi:MYXO-CTERM domain-containing protein
VCEINDGEARCGGDSCNGVVCGEGRVCVTGQCVDDPCAHVECPAGEACEVRDGAAECIPNWDDNGEGGAAGEGGAGGQGGAGAQGGEGGQAMGGQGGDPGPGGAGGEGEGGAGGEAGAGAAGGQGGVGAIDGEGGEGGEGGFNPGEPEPQPNITPGDDSGCAVGTSSDPAGWPAWMLLGLCLLRRRRA